MKSKYFYLSLLTFSLSGSLFAQASADLRAQAKTIFMSSCAASCHSRSASPIMTTSSGDLDWTSIQSSASRIVARLQANTMPPTRAPLAQQITAEQRQVLIDFTKTLLPPETGGLPLSTLKVPAGFGIELFAKAEGARSLTVSPEGIVFVGTGGFSNVDPNGRVYAIVPTAAGRKIVTLAWNLDNPNGVALRGNDLYVAELTRVIKFSDAIAYVKANVGKDLGKKSAPFTEIYNALPEQPTHSWKYVGFGPDDKLYINIGAPCNICLPDRDTFASIFRMNPDGSNFEQVARGVRNTVGFDWHPETHDLWFTDNGRDELGDNIPPDELNRLSLDGQDFGYPYCHAKTITDPKFGKNENCASDSYTKPEVELGAHVAALGVTFYRGTSFPLAYRNQTFIAEHGSWNRTTKSGYRLSLVQITKGLDGKVQTSYQPFISGWLKDSDQTVWGRPVDVKTYIDGSLLLSDDQAGAVYRIFYKGN